MLFIALFSHLYWNFGSIVGGVLGQLIPFRLEGIDFCMTALFIIIFIDQWENSVVAGNTWEKSAAGLVVAVTYKWKHNTLLSILIGTVVYMVLLWVR